MCPLLSYCRVTDDRLVSRDDLPAARVRPREKLCHSPLGRVTERKRRPMSRRLCVMSQRVDCLHREVSLLLYTPMQTYTGGCHCGRVRYEATTDLAHVIECNCSHCSKKAFLLNFIPAHQFKLLSGEEALTDYQFNKKHIHHVFCQTCGVQSFGYGPGPQGGVMYAINVRCMEGVDVSRLTITPFDGKSV